MTKRRSQTRKTDYTRWRGAERSHGEWNFSNRAQTPRKREREEISVTPERELRGQETGRGKRSFTTIFGVSLSLCLSHFFFLSPSSRFHKKKHRCMCAQGRKRKKEREIEKRRGGRERKHGGRSVGWSRRAICGTCRPVQGNGRIQQLPLSLPPPRRPFFGGSTTLKAAAGNTRRP